MKENKNIMFEFDAVVIAKALWHKLWIVILAVILFATSGFVIADRFITPKYTASTMIYVNNTNENPQLNQFNIQSSELTAAQSLVDTYIVILKTSSTIREIINEANLTYSVEDLRNMIEAVSENDTEIFRVKVTSEDPDEAILIANTITKILPDRISSIVENSSVKTVQKANSASETYPVRRKFALVGGLFGLLLVCFLIVIKELNDDNIYNEDYINETITDINVLAKIPDLMEDNDAKAKLRAKQLKEKIAEDKLLSKLDREEAIAYQLFLDHKKRGQAKIEEDIEKTMLCENLEFNAAESYKILRTNLLYNLPRKTDNLGNVIGITSAERQEGKSTTSINLSYVLAQKGLRVLTIEGDLRKPSVAKRLNIHADSGLTDIANNLPVNCDNVSLDILRVVNSNKLDNWKILTAGTQTQNPSEILSSNKLKTLIKMLKTKFDIIIVDLPPINEVTDAMAMASMLDAITFVVKERSSTKTSFQMAIRQLQLAKAPLIGFILTNSKGGLGKYEKYGYYRKYYKKDNKYYQDFTKTL